VWNKTNKCQLASCAIIFETNKKKTYKASTRKNKNAPLRAFFHRALKNQQLQHTFQESLTHHHHRHHRCQLLEVGNVWIFFCCALPFLLSFGCFLADVSWQQYKNNNNNSNNTIELLK
jgi:hypothetical protein